MPGAITIRFNHELYSRLKDEARERKISLNQLVAEAAQEYLITREREKAIRDLQKQHAKLKARYGIQPDSVPLLRKLREEN